MDSNSNIIRTISYNYNAAGEMTAASDPDSRYSYSYDLAGRLATVDNTGTAGVPPVLLSYSYDAVGNLTRVTDTINGVGRGITEYSYDALNRATRITQSGTGVVNKRVDMSYDAASQLKSISRYGDLNGTQLVASSTYNYDAAGRLSNLTHARGTTTLAAYSFEYDAIDRITRLTSPDGTSNYSYDAVDQLTGVDHSYQGDEAYSYDGNGNRTNTGYQTGSNNQLLSDGVYNYEYDGEGNRTKRTSIATGEVTEYVWDYRNRLTVVTVKNAAGSVIRTAQYAYDVFDRRIAKVVDPDGVGSAVATTERFVYDGDDIVLSFDGSGTQTHRYLYGTQVDSVLADENAAGQVLWALADNQGTVRDVVNSAGTVVNHITYDSYGNVKGQTNPAVEFRFGYTGRELDGETGQYYYRARYYDAAVGRFISEDTIGFAAGDANLYRYVGNSPVNRIDPSGNDWLDTAYNVGNGLDQFAAGFGDAVSFGATTRMREAMYGDVARQNHRGGLFNAGQLSGVAASTAVGFGAAGNASRGGGWAVRAAQGYTAVGDAVGVYQSTSNLLRNCFTPADLLGFAPVAGYLGGRALRGFGDVDDAARAGNVPVCFVAGTEILTTEGIKNIEDIKVGDWVIADDPTTPGEIEARQVLDTFVRETTQLYDLYVDGEVISTTGEHPFWVPDKGWVEAKDLQVRDLLQTNDETFVDIDKIERRSEQTTVYNFTVEGFHTYFVSGLGILVHNTCQPVPEDVTNGPHGPGRSMETVVSRAINDKQPQGRWLSKIAGESAVANLDPSKMEVGRAYSVPLNSNEGIIVRAYNEYPETGTPASQRYIIDKADRAVVILKKNGLIHTFPIGPEHPAYNINAPTK